MTATLSPAVHEGVIARHMKTDTDDPQLTALHAALKSGREAADKAAKLVGVVKGNKMMTPAAAQKKARDVSFKLLEDPLKSFDAAIKSAQVAIEELETRTHGPSAPKDLVGEARQRELRERLSLIPKEQRQKIINEAVAHDDDVLLSAVLGVPPWLVQMSQSEQEMVRHSWRSKRFATDLDRLERLNKAVRDAQHAGPLLLSFMDSLTDAKLIAEAEASDKATQAALASAG